MRANTADVWITLMLARGHGIRFFLNEKTNMLEMVAPQKPPDALISDLTFYGSEIKKILRNNPGGLR